MFFIAVIIVQLLSVFGCICVSGNVDLTTSVFCIVVLQATQVDSAEEQKDHLQTTATLTCRSS